MASFPGKVWLHIHSSWKEWLHSLLPRGEKGSQKMAIHTRHQESASCAHQTIL